MKFSMGKKVFSFQSHLLPINSTGVSVFWSSCLTFLMKLKESLSFIEYTRSNPSHHVNASALLVMESFSSSCGREKMLGRSKIRNDIMTWWTLICREKQAWDMRITLLASGNQHHHHQHNHLLYPRNDNLCFHISFSSHETIPYSLEHECHVKCMSW